MTKYAAVRDAFELAEKQESGHGVKVTVTVKDQLGGTCDDT